MTKESFIAAFIASTPIGRTGWQARAAHAALAAWEEAMKAEEYARACDRAQQEWHARAERESSPAWRVVEEWGTYSFAGECYGARAVFGGGALTFAEAHAQSVEICNSTRCKRAGDAWNAYLNG